MIIIHKVDYYQYDVVYRYNTEQVHQYGMVPVTNTHAVEQTENIFVPVSICQILILKNKNGFISTYISNYSL